MLGWLKKKLQDRIEKNAVKIPGLEWTDRSGIVHREDVVLKRSTIPLYGDWTRIHPPIDENNKISFINLLFGGKRNVIILLTFMLILASVYYWTTGILGSGAEYLDGSKYVIMNYSSFDKFCNTRLITDVRGVSNWSVNGTFLGFINITPS